jgi:transposase
MKNYKEVVGIDVSKKTIDAYCHQATLTRSLRMKYQVINPW